MRTTVLLTLKQIFQRELHDPRVQRCKNLAELSGRQIRIDHGTATLHSWAETIQHIKRFDSKLHRLTFADMEGTGHTHVELPEQRQ